MSSSEVAHLEVSEEAFCGVRPVLTLNVSFMQDVTRGMDTSLTLKLQKRVTELEQEKQSLRNELENKEEQFQRARARVREPALRRRLSSLKQIPAQTQFKLQYHMF